MGRGTNGASHSSHQALGDAGCQSHSECQCPVSRPSALITGRPQTATGTRSPRLQLLWENFLLSVVSFLQSTGLEVSHSPPCAAMETLFVTSKTLNTSHAPDLPDSETVSARQYQNPGFFPKQHGLFCDPDPALVGFFLWALPPCPQPTK